ncbi:MAG TPA: DNA gyrase/topoisomerase IV subunit A [Cytophagales bacterium]|nr:DNA gyrase/topoisomerase IV subunit A [Cytophagales bacterium]
MREEDVNDLPEEDFDANKEEGAHDVIPVSGMYQNWFLDYASYVILERAVPALEDGLKPVQRRILHSMKEMDDGRYNKVANIIGQTMQYHPHGDASIGEAMVNMGQKDLLIDTQGNWGDIRTGDSAAAARYIEARLSKFALDIAFNSETTDWQLSYDGRKKEPITLPMKFPLLLAQGVEGIAVGLATKILPHNFCELIEASVAILQNKEFTLYPDFPTGGMVDVTNYNGGLKGGKIRVRAKIEEFDKKTLVIKDIPFGTNTVSLIESIVKANDAGKIKIKKVIDNTAKEVEIMIQLAPGTSPDITVDALYAFTDCEVSISPNSCVISNDRPEFLAVDELLRRCTAQTLVLLKKELEIKKGQLLEKLLFSSLEKIFIENRIYRDIEECETWEDVISTIDKGLEPYKAQFYRTINEEDIVSLTEIKIKRISRFDTFKADELMRKLEEELKETEHHIEHIVDYTIVYYLKLLEKYGKGRERKTEIRLFDVIQATVVAAANQKLYVNRQEGFVGYGLKKDEYVCDCSDLDDIIAFRADGGFKVSRISEKDFMGKDIIHVAIFRKNDERTVYNMAYLDGKEGVSYVKRFQVVGVTRDKEYDLTKGNKGSKVHYFSANHNGEAEVVTVFLTSGCKAKIKVFDFDFAEIAIKGRSSQGNILTKYPIRKVQFKMAGLSTLGGMDIYYDDSIGRLNSEKRGTLLGNFKSHDLILVIYKKGSYEITNFELTNRYEPDQVSIIEKFDPNTIISAVHFDGAQKNYFVKRFKIETSTLGKNYLFISDSPNSYLVVVTTDKAPQLEISYQKGAKGIEEKSVFDFDILIDVKGWKALGNRLSPHHVVGVKLLASQSKDDKEVSLETEEKNPSAPIKSESFETGTTIDLTETNDPKQLGLF